MDNLSLYEDIKARTGGEIYLGVVGPVRTGKSTFIRRFMDLCIIPSISMKKGVSLTNCLRQALGKR